MTKQLLVLALLTGTGQSYSQVESAAPTFRNCVGSPPVQEHSRL